MELNVKNRIREAICRKEGRGFVFKPSRTFFQEIGINQKEWGKIIRNEQQPRLDQLASIARYFGIDQKDLF